MAQKQGRRRRMDKGDVKDGGRPAYPHLELPPEPPLPDAPLSDRKAWEAYAVACLTRSRTVAALIQAHGRQRTLASEARKPLDFRAQHRAVTDERPGRPGRQGPVVERLAQQIPDAEGRAGHPHRAYDTLATLFRNGSIDRDELAAGRQFEEAFRLARLDPLHASNPARIKASGVRDLSNGMVAGREAVARAMKILGGYASPAGSAIWWVLGCGHTIKEFAQATQLGGGRSLDEKTAKGVLYP
ncbi:MAG: hypothetical protein ACFCUQ_08030 [Kiloniellales bacterium]